MDIHSLSVTSILLFERKNTRIYREVLNSQFFHNLPTLKNPQSSMLTNPIGSINKQNPKSPLSYHLTYTTRTATCLKGTPATKTICRSDVVVAAAWKRRAASCGGEEKRRRSRCTKRGTDETERTAAAAFPRARSHSFHFRVPSRVNLLCGSRARIDVYREEVCASEREMRSECCC